jgi:hypothetical protein
MPDLPSRLAYHTPAALTPLVQRALQNDAAQVETWQADPIGGGAGDQGAGTAGIYRLHGLARAGAESLPWQMVLKYAPPGPGGSELSGDEREWQAYASGVLATLPGPLAAPRCYSAETRPDGELWLWLEAIGDEGGDWAPAEYAQAAYQLGVFNAGFAARGLAWPWLSRQWLRGWVAQRGDDIALLRVHLPEHPDVQRVYPPDVAGGMLALWDDRERLLGVLEALPQTFCHQDAFRRNLLARRGPDGQRLVLIDWAFAGLAAVGEELAALIIASEGFEHAAAPDMPGLEAAVYPAYVDGLRAGGWTGDERAVRFAYCAAASLRYGLPILMARFTTPRLQAWFSALFRTPVEVLDAQEPVWRRYLLRLADEARALLPQVT